MLHDIIVALFRGGYLFYYIYFVVDFFSVPLFSAIRFTRGTAGCRLRRVAAKQGEPAPTHSNSDGNSVAEYAFDSLVVVLI